MITLTVAERAGNVSTLTEQANIAVPDPQRPALELVEIDDDAVLIAVTGSPGSNMNLLVDSGDVLAEFVVDEGGEHEVELEMDDGEYGLVAFATNFDGARSDDSEPLAITLDRTPPTVRVVNVEARADAVRVTLETDDPDATITLGEGSRTGSGDLVLEGLAAGDHTLTLAAVDLIGNEIDESFSVTVPREAGALGAVLLLGVLGAAGYGFWRFLRRGTATPDETPPPTA